MVDTLNRPIKTVIIPAAGRGLRLLPATKAVPKEMLMVGDRPVIQHSLEEAAQSGLEKVVIVTSEQKQSLIDHLSVNHSLEELLHDSDKQSLLTQVRAAIPDTLRIEFVFQPDPKGLGDAILKAKNEVNEEAFAVILPDDLLFDVKTGQAAFLSRLIKTMQNSNSRLGVAVETIQPKDYPAYGVVSTEEDTTGAADAPPVHKVKSLIEKPPIPAADELRQGDFGVVGRYVLPREIFDILQTIEPGSGGEIQLTDAIVKLMANQSLYALPIGQSYERFDCGSFDGLAKANMTKWGKGSTGRTDVENRISSARS